MLEHSRSGGGLLRATAVALLVFAGGCAARPGPEVLAIVATPVPEGARPFHIYAATTRARDAEGSSAFTSKWATRTNYASFSISIPPGHRAGEIEWPRGRPDPRTSFAVLGQQALDDRAFFAAVSAAAAHRKVGVVVHGYNVNYQEALFRLAQMTADANLDGVPVLFAWPSQATLSGYGADREAVTYSRDDLAALLVRLTARPGSRETMVFAHSMGSWLVMEVLRQLRLQGRDDVLSRLRVFLAAPDIDENVFQAQLAVIGRMRMPITIFVSKDDRALKLSGLLTGDGRRVGVLDVTDPAVMQAAKDKSVRIIDISALAADDGLGHGRYAKLASTVPHLEGDASGRTSPLGAAGAFILDAAGATLTSPLRLASKIVNP